MNQEKINFRVSRDFGETFNASFKFIRQNFKQFFASLLLIAGPFVLISAIAGALYQANALAVATSGYNTSPFAQFGWEYFTFLITAGLANIALVATVFAFMMNYMEKGPGNFTVNDVARTVGHHAGLIIGIFFTIGIICGLIIAVIVGIFIGLGSAVPVLAILLGFGAVIGMLIIVPPLIWRLAAVYLVAMQENLGIFEAFAKTGQVMRGHFWWTWVIVFVASLAIGMIGFVFSLPQVVYQVVLTFTSLSNGDTSFSVPFVIVSAVCTFFATLVHGMIHVINGIHYYSLAEKQDGLGLMERINEIGNAPKNDAEQQF
jgi:hypothetical protein